MAEMPAIEPSVETFFWLSNVWQNGWPDGYVRREELESILEQKFVSMLSRFGPKIAQPYPYLAKLIIEDLIENGVVSVVENAIAGKYYSLDVVRMGNRRQVWLSDNDLYAQVSVVGVKLLDDVFLAFSAAEAGAVLPDDRSAPAADRTVTFSDNIEAYGAALDAYAVLEQAVAEQNDFGNLSDLEVAAAKVEVHEIGIALKAGTGRVGRFWSQANSTLTWLGKESASTLVGAAALALLGALYHLLKAFF